MRRLWSLAGDQPRSRLPFVADARVGARFPCAVPAVGRISAVRRPLAPWGMLYSGPPRLTSPSPREDFFPG